MANQSEAVSMWFDRRLVMRASRIHGTGVFATDAIRAGERLYWISGGVVYSTEDWRTGKVQLDPERYNEAQIDDDLFVATPITLAYYINHSCEPNMLANIAWRDIEAGEELTCDYASDEASPNWKLEPCICGSAICRGSVTGDDWKLPELQKRYRGYFSPRIEGLIRASNPNA
jgi:SET domain-containing protein